MAHRVLRAVGIALLSLVVLCGALALGAWVWLQTDSGRETVLRRANRRLAEEGVAIEADRMGGRVLSSVRLENVEAQLCPEKLRVRARRLRIDYSLWSVLHGTPQLSLLVEEPSVAKLPASACAGADGGPRLLRLPRRIELERVRVTSGGSRLEIAGVAGSDGIDLRVDGVLAPGRQVRGLLALHARVTGRLEDLRLAGELAPAARSVRIVPAVGEADVVLSGRMELEGRGGLAEGFEVSARGEGRYSRRLIDPDLVPVAGGRALERFAQPGSGGVWRGRLNGRAGGKGARLRFHFELAGEKKAKTVLEGTFVR
jgi:hypothetical protein